MFSPVTNDTKRGQRSSNSDPLDATQMFAAKVTVDGNQVILTYDIYIYILMSSRLLTSSG